MGKIVDFGQAYQDPCFQRRTFKMQILADVTDKCQLNCRYCYFGEKGCSVVDPERSARAIMKLIHVMHERLPQGVSSIHLQAMGGEPLVAKKQMFDLVDAVCAGIPSEMMFSWGLTSNLVGLTSAVATEIKKRDGRIHSSIDGTKKIHDHNRPFNGGVGSYQSVVDNIPNLFLITPDDTARVTVCPEDADKLDQIADHLFSLGYRYVGLFPAFNLGWDSKNIDQWSQSFRRTLDMTMKKWPACGIRTIMRFRERAAKFGWAWAYCGAGRTLFAFDVNGLLYECHHLTSRTKGIDVLMLDDNEVFERITQSPITPRLSQHPEVCRSCSAAGHCNGGGCWSDNLLYTNDPNTPYDVTCQMKRKCVDAFRSFGTDAQVHMATWDMPDKWRREKMAAGGSGWFRGLGEEIKEYSRKFSCDGGSCDHSCDCNDGSSWCESYCVACDSMC